MTMDKTSTTNDNKIIDLAEDFEANENPKQKNTEEGNIFLKPPRQLQRWGEKQALPHVNWGDLFFDLFYVAAAYNLAYILKNDPNWTGVLYVFGCLGPILWVFWTDRMAWDSRFFSEDDVGHRIGEVIQLCTLATAVLHIRPVKYMSELEENTEMMIYSVAIFMGIMMGNSRLFEIAFWWFDGDEGAKHYCKRELLLRIPSVILVGFAAGYSTFKYFGDSSSDKDYRYLASGSTDDKTSEDYLISHLPIILCASLLVVWPFCFLMANVICLPDITSYKKYSAPINVEFVIHRYGELTMLLLGESILSLLIVEMSKERGYYVAFYSGIVSAISLQYLHYKSQPDHAKDHAFNHSRKQGMMFMFVSTIYGGALIIVGACYKMFLTEFTSEYAESESSDYRMLFSHKQPFVGEFERFLASGGSGAASSMTKNERQKAIADLFCYGLTLLFVSQDIMILCHHNYKTSLRRIVNRKGIIVLVLHTAVICFMATLSQYMTDPEAVTLIGLCSIVVQVILRLVGSMCFSPLVNHHHHNTNEVEEEEEEEDERYYL